MNFLSEATSGQLAYKWDNQGVLHDPHDNSKTQ
jgi:hypothetical protein